MIRIAALLLCMVVATHAASVGLPDLSSTTPLEVSKTSLENTSISLQAPQIQIKEATYNFENFQSFEMDGEPVYYAEGCPSVPHVTRLYRIPNTGNVELIVNSANYSVLDNIHPLPIQKEENQFYARADRDPDVYSRDAWYPAEPCWMSEPKIFRDFRIVEVTLFPVQVNPVTGQARIYDDLSVDVVSTGGVGENELRNPHRPSRAFKSIYQDMIVNLDDQTLDDFTATPGQYMILCKNDTSSLRWVDSLRTWKRRLGWDVVVQSQSSWTYNQMKTAIQNLYDTADPPLEFVTIIGDVDGPPYSMPTGPNGDQGQFDHYFTTLAGSDNYEDVSVGRLSVRSSNQLATVMAKIFLYERTPYMDDPSWFTSAFLYAGTANGVTSNVIMTRWARNQFQNLTDIDDVSLATHSNDVSNSVIGQHFNDGISVFLWRGTVVGEMDNTSATCMNPSNRLPITLTITCGSGWFTNEAESISEAFLRAGTPNAPEGGVCGIGTATFGTHVPYNNTMAGGLIYGICNLGLQYLGSAVTAAKAELLRSYPSQGNPQDFVYWNNLMGDPGLSLWTTTPVVMDVDFPGTVNVGARRIRPQVTDEATGEPIADALCVLWKGDETYARSLTDAGGFVDMAVAVNTPGTMTLTVSKRNHKPFLADINCITTAENVTVQSLAVDDDNSGGTSGNNDDNMNPGETIDLMATLHNFGDSGTATNISSSLTSDNADVTVVNGSANYANVDSGASVTGTTAYRIQVSPLMRQGEDVKLTFTVNTGTQTTFSTVILTCRAARSSFEGSTVSGGNNNDNHADPGEVVNLRVTIRNNGEVPMTNVTGTLVSRYSLLSVVDNNGTFGDIAVGATVDNMANQFQVRANSVAYNGSQGNLLLVINADGGHVDSIGFSLPIGVATADDPTGPDAYGYYAYDNADTAFEWTRPYLWTDISGLGVECTHASQDPGEQTNVTSTYSDAVALPFPFMFYGQTYDTITICSNGWAAFGNQSELDMFRNYPLPGSQAPDAMLAPFWDDMKTTGNLGVYRYYDETNNRFTIQWNAQCPFNSASEVFQAILLDPVHYPTDDGNGIVMFQYNAVTEFAGDNNDPNFSSIGIQAPGCTVGLQYRFSTIPAPGAISNIVSGRAITITTEASLATGTITGVVTDEETGSPLAGVEVTAVEEVISTMTNALGEYTIPDVPIGTYTVRARLHGYNDGIEEGLVVEMDSTEYADFSLLHPEIQLSTDDITITLPGDPLETSFNISNNGNGPLDYSMYLEYAHEGTQGGDWSLINHIDVSAETGDFQIQGCEFAGDYWYVTGMIPPSDKRIYRFDLLGNPVGSFPQPPSEHPLGWYDMAFDGNYLYGSAQNQHKLYGINLNGALRDSIPLPANLSPARGVAYDPASNHFWVCDVNTDVFEIDRQGNVINRFATGLSSKWGLAWNASDPIGYKLYVFNREDNGNQTVISRIHPVSGDVNLVHRLQNSIDDRAGGCTITHDWNSTLLVFAGVLQNPAGDRLEIRQLDFDTDWIAVTPMFSSVNPQSSRDITVAIDPAGLRDLTYHVNLFIQNNSATDLVAIPITLATTLTVPEAPGVLPKEYALFQNYPNPFNGRTTFAFDLKQAGYTSLKIYNLLGQQVATVLDGYRDAGSHTISYDMGSVSSGVYLYRIESGSFSETRKLVLMK